MVFYAQVVKARYVRLCLTKRDALTAEGEFSITLRTADRSECDCAKINAARGMNRAAYSKGNFQFLDRFYLERYESDSRKPRTFLPENWTLLKSPKTHPETVSAWSQPVHEGLGPRSVSTRDVSCFPRHRQYRP